MNQQKARKALETVAKQHGVPLETVLQEIEQTIRTAMDSPDPAIRARWNDIPRKGTAPTPEELLTYLAKQLSG